MSIEPLQSKNHPCLQEAEQVTTEVLQKALRNWRLGKLAPDELLSLGVFDHNWGPYGRDLLLHDWVEQSVLEQVRFYCPDYSNRISQPSPVKSETIRIGGQLINRMMDENLANGAAWIILYLRWVIPYELPSAQLAEAANLSERHMRRMARYALSRLSRRLRQEAFETCQSADRT